ncbi:uncharacterized protein LOC124634261 [Helicoverpa zea]|uniref:uncharacterized protein LOC124634261 n=1 Tax=Helicoverpa zea TaxID=7113 RepID=UPI001F5753F4|nr:uncharacterized protein LOC124634261 [Helicoverpa zea]
MADPGTHWLLQRVHATSERRTARRPPFCNQYSVRMEPNQREFRCKCKNMVTALKDGWTEEKCIQLIREYRIRPLLWDQKNPLFYRKDSKPKAWEEVGNALNTSPDVCKHKMNTLLSSFRREKAKIMHSIKETGDTSQAHKSIWFAFKDMSFLLDKENERKRQLNSTDDDVDDDDDDDDDSTSNNHLIRNLETPVPMKRCRLSLSVRKELGQKIADLGRARNIQPSLQPAPGPSQTPEEREEEIKSFATFIASKMKKYSDVTKNAVQQAICDVIFKADQNHYDQDCFTIIDDDTDPLNRDIYHLTDAEIKVQPDSDNSD